MINFTLILTKKGPYILKDVREGLFKVLNGDRSVLRTPLSPFIRLVHLDCSGLFCV